MRRALALLAATCLLAAAPVTPAPATPQTIDLVDTHLLGRCTAAVGAGDTVVLAFAGVGLQVLVFSPPAPPFVTAEIATGSWVGDLALQGDHVFVANGDAGVRILDISEPWAPQEVASLPVGGARALDLVDGRLAVASAHGQVRLYDVTAPAQPELLATLATDFDFADIALAGDLAYGAAHRDGGHVLSLQLGGPGEPAILDDLAVGDQVNAVAAVADRLLVGYHDRTLDLLDISDPAALADAGDLPLVTHCWDIHVAGDRAYLACGWDGYKVADVADPHAVELVALAYTDDTVASWVDGATAFVADGDEGLRIFDVSSPPNLHQLAHHGTGGLPSDVTATDTHAFVLSETEGLIVLETADHTGHEAVATLHLPGTPVDADLAGSLLYVAAEMGGGVSIVDVSDPGAPHVAGAIPSGHFRTVLVHAGHLYAGLHADRLRVYSLASPTQPQLVAELELTGPRGLAAAGDRLYVADDSAGLTILGIADPASPIVLGGHDTPGYARDVAVRGTMAYVADWDGGLQVIDCTDPAAPVLTDAHDPGGQLQRVVLSPGHVYAAGGGVGLVAFAMAEEGLVTPAGTFGTPYLVDVAFTGGYVYAVDTSRGIFVLHPEQEVSAEPVTLRARAEGGCRVLAWSGVGPLGEGCVLQLVRMAADGGEAVVHREAAGGRPWTGCGTARDCEAVRGGVARYRLELACRGGRVSILATVACRVEAADLTLGPAEPNPFNPATTIAFRLDGPGRVQLTVHDVAGRRVATLVDGELAGGEQRVVWDGRGQGGAEMASGAYFVRLRTGGGVRASKVLLVR